MIQDLTDIYEEYATPFMKHNSTYDNGLGLSQASVGGRLYGIPDTSVGAGAYQFMFIREDWRQQLGLPEPRTMDDVLNMARAFVEADLDGMSAYGIAISNQPYETYFTVRGFFDSYGAHINQWVNKGGRLEHGIVQPEVKTALANFNQWYKDGLLDPEFIVKGSYDMSQEAIGGRVGVLAGEWWLTTWPLPDGYRLGQDWRAYYIPFDASNSERLYSGRAMLGSRFVARSGFANPEALIKMCNLFQERALSNKWPAEIYRTDGEFHYDGLAAFRPTMGPDRNAITQRNITLAVDTGDTSHLDGEDDWSKYGSVIDYINGVNADNPDIFATNFMWWRAYYGPDAIFAMMDRMTTENKLKLDAYYDPPTTTMAEFEGQLRSMAEEMINNIIMGFDSVDSFDNFVAAWYANGGQEWTDEINEWFAGK
jgi:putative aldouronate transport system substrate-binding protein